MTDFGLIPKHEVLYCVLITLQLDFFILSLLLHEPKTHSILKCARFTHPTSKDRNINRAFVT
jgi:hypothetical protein